MRLAQIGPLWVNALLAVRLFGTRQNVERRLKKLEQTGRLRTVGRVSIDGGRKTQVWCNRKIADRMLRHEVHLMRVFFTFWPHAYALSGGDVDTRWKADMEMTIGDVVRGRKYMVEIDEDTEPLHQVRTRLATYEDCPHAVLFITPTLIRAAEALRVTTNPKVYATTIEQCLLQPWGPHWRNCRGEAGIVAKPGAQGDADGAAQAAA